MLLEREIKRNIWISVGGIYKHTSWPLPLTTSGASTRRARGNPCRFFLPKSYKDFALSTSWTSLRRIGTVPVGHRVPFWCHTCQSTTALLLLTSDVFSFGNSGGTFCTYIAMILKLKKNINDITTCCLWVKEKKRKEKLKWK